MALLSTWTDANRIDDQLITVQITNTRVSPVPGWHLYDRVASGRYRYVGLTKDAALSCAQDKMDQYAYVQAVDYDPSTSQYILKTFHGANVAATHEDGEMYTVDVNVNVNDSAVLSSSGTPTPGQIHAAFSFWDFD